MEKLRNMPMDERVDELFVIIGTAIQKGISNDEIGVLHTPLTGKMFGYEKEHPIILDKWKGKLAKEIAEVI